MTSANDLYCGCCGGSDQAPPKGMHGACCAELHGIPPRCRTCGFTDCPGAAIPGGCTRWPGTEATPAEAAGRIPLVPPGMPEDTPSARRLGAAILGRALAHAEALGDGFQFPRTTAAMCGFTRTDGITVRAAYRELLGV